MKKSPVYDLSSVRDAQTCGIRHIGIGVYSSGKIREYLRRMGFEAGVCDEAVQNLIKREYIDDCRAGRKVLLSRSGKKQESKSMLYKRLIVAGVSRDKAELLLSQVEEDVILCFNLYLSIMPCIEVDNDDDEEDNDDVIASIQNQLQKLAYKRGFDSDTSSRAFRLWLEKVM